MRFVARVDRTSRARQVIDTQKQLITRGWQLLKPGGVLVYSTCSLVAQQNEVTRVCAG